MPAIAIWADNRPYERCRSQAKLTAAQTTKLMKLTHLMKTYLFALQTALMLSALAAHGQGTLIYDQQSATNRDISAGFVLQAQPEGMSFTPALASVGFVQFEFLDDYAGGGVGATLYVNLLAGSISGTVLDSTAPVFMPYGFYFGITNFFFATSVAVTPGTTYYLQPVLQSGDSTCYIIGGLYNYPGGTSFFDGAPDPDGYDLWFREGVLVPEPASSLLVLLGIAAIWAARRLRTKGLVLILVAAGAAGICSARAQTTQTNSGRAYFSMQRPEWPPLPAPKPGCAVFALPGQPGFWRTDQVCGFVPAKRVNLGFRS